LNAHIGEISARAAIQGVHELAIKDLLFHLTPDETPSAGGEFAVSLAQAHGAFLTAASLAVDYPPQFANGGTFAGGLELSVADSFGELSEQNRKVAREAYDRLAQSFPVGLCSEFVTIETFPQLAADDFGRLARRFDLAVIAQGAPLAPDIITGALFGSGRPALVLPRGFAGAARLTKAMVCWDGGAPAAKALAESLPLLARAEKVEIVCVKDEGKLPGRPSGLDIMRHLERHGVVGVLSELPASGDEGAALLSHAAESGADFIVMGAYGHWRLRELIFGGTTQKILGQSQLPLFLAH
jgi:nucleotide-binding universal stress UspA family protein